MLKKETNTKSDFTDLLYSLFSVSVTFLFRPAFPLALIIAEVTTSSVSSSIPEAGPWRMSGADCPRWAEPGLSESDCCIRQTQQELLVMIHRLEYESDACEIVREEHNQRNGLAMHAADVQLIKHRYKLITFI